MTPFISDCVPEARQRIVQQNNPKVSISVSKSGISFYVHHSELLSWPHHVAKRICQLVCHGPSAQHLPGRNHHILHMHAQ